MKKLISVLAILILSVNCHALEFSAIKPSIMPLGLQNHYGDGSYQGGLNRGLTFYKNFDGNLNLNARYAGGSSGFVFTRTAGDTATLIDANGVVRNAQSATPRFAGGYYDATGFHRANGLMIEAAGTNLLTYTDGSLYGANLYTNWAIGAFISYVTGVPTTSVTLNPELSSISSSKSQKVVYTGNAGDAGRDIAFGPPLTGVGAIAQNDVLTTSVWARSITGNSGVTIKVSLKIRDAAGAALSTEQGSDISGSLTSSWRKFSFTVTVTNANASRFFAYPAVVQGIDNGDTVDVEIYGLQTEKNPYPTSFIPTTTAALTRNAETLKYSIPGNRTAEQETIVIKLIPGWAGSEIASTGDNVITSTETKARQIAESSTTDDFIFYPNATDTIGALVKSGVAIVKNSSTVLTCLVYGTTGDPNSGIKDLGGSLVTNNTDFKLPAWGLSFSIGSSTGGSSQANSIIQKVAFFKGVLSTGEISALTNILYYN